MLGWTGEMYGDGRYIEEKKPTNGVWCDQGHWFLMITLVSLVWYEKRKF